MSDSPNSPLPTDQHATIADSGSTSQSSKPTSTYQRPAKLQTRDHISIGVYTALYFLLISIAAGFIHALPIGLPFMGFACGMLGAVPLLLMLFKSRRFGAVTVMSVLLAIVLGAIHGNYYTVLTALLAGLGADLIAKAGRYGKHSAWLAAGVFNLWNIGMFLPFYLGRDNYLANLAAEHNAAYAQQLAALFPGWMLPVLVALSVIGGVLGAALGTGLLGKHFKRAGLL